MAEAKVTLKGFVRFALEDVRGKHKGRVRTSGWQKNLVVNDGFAQYICAAYASVAGSKQVSHMGIASGTQTYAAANTALVGEFTGTDGARKTVTATVTSSTTAQFIASWATNEANQSGLGSIGLFNTSSGGTAVSLATLSATSQKTTDQTLSVTYQHRFSTN